MVLIEARLSGESTFRNKESDKIAKTISIKTKNVP